MAVRQFVVCSSPLEGGISPPIRRRSARVLSFVEREEISRGIAAGQGIRAIARGLKRAPSTVSQESADMGDEAASGPRKPTRKPGTRRGEQSSACSPKANSYSSSLRAKEDRAPQQIAGWLKTEYPKNPELTTPRPAWQSHTTARLWACTFRHPLRMLCRSGPLAAAKNCTPTVKL